MRKTSDFTLYPQVMEFLKNVLEKLLWQHWSCKWERAGRRRSMDIAGCEKRVWGVNEVVLVIEKPVITYIKMAIS